MKLNARKNPGRRIWRVAVAAVLAALLWTLLTDALGGRNAPGDVIALTPGEKSEALLHTVYRPAEPQPGAQTEDSSGCWESSTAIDLFRAAYANSRGAVTVRGAGETKRIAPGTAQCYAFAVSNTGNTALDYSLSLTQDFSTPQESLPMEFRLHRGGEWLLGGEEQWCSREQLDEWRGSSALKPQDREEYLLEWRWPFEGTDAVDTALGVFPGTYTLSIATTARAAANAPAMDGHGNLLYERGLSARTVVLAAAAIAAGLPALLRRRLCVTGFAPAGEGQTMACGRRRDTLRPDGRFLFPRIAAGRHTFTLGEIAAPWRLRRRGNVTALFFAEDGTVTVGRDIRAVELYLREDLRPDTACWAAIDRKNRVYTPGGVQEPDENGENVTPGGLTVDAHGKFSLCVRETEEK